MFDVNSRDSIVSLLWSGFLTVKGEDQVQGDGSLEVHMIREMHLLLPILALRESELLHSLALLNT